MSKEWDGIRNLTEQYRKLNLDQVLDYRKFNLYSIVHHSTQIEGSTLTESEIQVFLEEDMTAKGKTFEEHQMVKDHWDALLFAMDLAGQKKSVSEAFISDLSAKVMKNTGKSYNTALGTFDSSKGEYRRVNVFAGKSSFVNFEKVPALMKEFCSQIAERMNVVSDIEDVLKLAFDAHYNMVTIHPFADGNGRVSRLVMNYIEHFFQQPLSIVYKEDKASYYDALVMTREKSDIGVFRKFMMEQHKKMLLLEIAKAPGSEARKKNSDGLSFLF